nr:MAG TPA: Pre-mRNA-splicing factor 8, Pre-mRNA-splicing factor, pre-mRNA splicing, snRNP, GTPase [Caudoviricetes sp.]
MSTFSSAPSAPTPAPPPPATSAPTPPPPPPPSPQLASVPPAPSVPFSVMTPPRPTNRFVAWLRRPRSTGEGMAMGAVALIVGVIGLSLAWRVFWWLQVFFAYFATVGTLGN